MILILASQLDAGARDLAAACGDERAALMTPRDLSRPGWAVPLDAPTSGRGAIASGRIALAEVTGIVALLPWIPAQELNHIHPDDRAYVAAEMNAFLVFLLAALPCPKLNPSTPTCHNGPGWRHTRWAMEAAHCGFRPASGDAAAPGDSAGAGAARSLRRLLVVGERCLADGAPCAATGDAAIALARRSGLRLLALNCLDTTDGPIFLGADPMADLRHGDAPAAVAALLQELMPT